MLETMEDREDVVAISAAMPTGTGLSAVAEQYPDRFFDVGIAEEHAVTFAAGLALGGSRPVVALYSTFCSVPMIKYCMTSALAAFRLSLRWIAPDWSEVMVRRIRESLILPFCHRCQI